MTVNIRKQISPTTDNNVQISPNSNLISPSEQIFDDSNPNLDENSKNQVPQSSTKQTKQLITLPNGKKKTIITTTIITIDDAVDINDTDLNNITNINKDKYEEIISNNSLLMLQSQSSCNNNSLFRSFVLADWITMMNAVCGVSCLLLCLNYLENGNESNYLTWAFVSLPFALLFDLLDGWVARKQQKQSPYGSDLDSLADCISFTLCPAALAFTIGLRSFWDCLILCFFQFCGLSRLARYNVTSQFLLPGQKVKYYEGFPVPTSLALDFAMYLLYQYDMILDDIPLGYVYIVGKKFHFISLIFVFWGCMFVSSSFRIPKP